MHLIVLYDAIPIVRNYSMRLHITSNHENYISIWLHDITPFNIIQLHRNGTLEHQYVVYHKGSSYHLDYGRVKMICQVF